MVAKKKKSSNRLWIYVGLLAILASLFSDFLLDYVDQLWRTLNQIPSADPKVQPLYRYVCSRAYCHPDLIIVGRSFITIQRIPANTRLLSIPRQFQIWDLDAFRDTDLQKYFGARHAETNNLIDRGAYISLHLMNENRYPSAWRQSLPTLQDFATHPISWNQDTLEQLLPKRTMSRFYIDTFRHMIKSDYEALTEKGLNMTIEDFQYYRMLVKTRKFGGRQVADQDMTPDERETFKEQFGYDATGGTSTMVFLADLINYHINRNTLWDYDSSIQSYVYTSAKDIEAGSELFISYGTYSEAYLLASYGFVSGDGSLPTNVYLAQYHDLLDAGMNKDFSMLPFDRTAGPTDRQIAQQHDLLQYLQYDDGYEECINPEVHEIEFEFKQIKWKYLLHIANDLKYWSMAFPARDSHRQPPKQLALSNLGDGPDYTDPKYAMCVSDSGIATTCRLLALRHDDFEGKAFAVLQNGLANLDKTDLEAVMPRTFKEVNERAARCMHRLIESGINSFEHTVAKEKSTVWRLNQEAPGSIEWLAAHSRLAELQTLHLLQSATTARYGDGQGRRQEACPAGWNVQIS